MNETINERPRKFDKSWIQEIREKMEARKKAIREGNIITKDNGHADIQK